MTRSVMGRIAARLSPVKETAEAERREETRERRDDLARRQYVARWLAGAFYAEREANHFAPNIDHALHMGRLRHHGP